MSGSALTRAELDSLRRLLPYATEQEKERIHAYLLGKAPPPGPVWTPLKGPQTAAYFSPARETLYGGAAGGGKSDWLLGLAFTSHRKSIIFRHQFPQFAAMIDRARQIIGDRGTYNAQDKVWRLADGRVVEFGAVEHEWDKEKYQGRPHDLVAFDELTHFTCSQFKFLTGWNRTDELGQRCRVVATCNPPTTAEGRWVVREWAPWLDRRYPNPAIPGELRWYYMLDGHLEWLESGEEVWNGVEWVQPISRTFYPALLQDNPYYMATGYLTTLQALPEPLRSQMLYGDFDAGTEDAPNQVIPTAWVEAAMKRWRADGCEGLPTTLGVDVARGGRCKTVVARRHANWMAPLVKVKGEATPDGEAVVALVVQELIKFPDSRPTVHIDATAVGSSPVDILRGMKKVTVSPVISSAREPYMRDRANVLGFTTFRSWAWWNLREALDPERGDGVALPDDPELLADLTAPTWAMAGSGVQVERKDKVEQRIGRSTDCGDAVVYCFLPQVLGIMPTFLDNGRMDPFDRVHAMSDDGAGRLKVTSNAERRGLLGRSTHWQARD